MDRHRRMWEIDYLNSQTGLVAIYDGYRAQIMSALRIPGTINVAGVPGTGKTHVLKGLASRMGLSTICWSLSLPQTDFEVSEIVKALRTDPGPGWVILELSAISNRDGLLQKLLLNLEPCTIPAGWRVMVVTTAPLPSDCGFPLVHFDHVS